MTGDCNYHPVSRFLYGWLATCFGELQYQHVIISLEDHREESYCDLFRSVPGIDVHDVSCLQGVDRLRAIRDCNYDVVVDLSGWTGGNFIAGLNARLSPIQVNYLGYFASSGLASMDYWIGDSELFPMDMQNGPQNPFIGYLGLFWPGRLKHLCLKRMFVFLVHHQVLFVSGASITTANLLIHVEALG